MMRNVMRGKFNPAEHDGTVECNICFEEYDANSKIVKLPCDARHFFHEKCIEEWLKQNNSCPLCKKPIT